MIRRQFLKNDGSLGAFSAGAAAGNLFSETAQADLPSAYGGSSGTDLKGPYLDLTTGVGNKYG